jgi:phloretin hydrolase
MSAYEFTHIPELTEEEKKSPYAQFYYEPILPPAPEIITAIQPGNEIDSAIAVAPQDIRKLLVPGFLKVDNGYCVLPDGTGFSVIHTRGPDVTLEMEQWWGTWFKSGDYNYLNYKIWMPSLHFTHANPIWEDLGWGTSKLYRVKSITPDVLDLPTSPKELNPDFLTLAGSAFTIIPDAPGEAPYYATLIHYTALGDDGLDVLTIVWSGIHILDGKTVRMIGKDERVDLEYVRLFACHNAWELARKMQLLPQLYAYSKTL